MKLKCAEIERIEASPSGQMVAHVKMESGAKFQMPFGQDASLDHIKKRVQEYVDERCAAKCCADKLHAEMMKQAAKEVIEVAKAIASDQRVVPIPGAKKLSRTRKVWLALSWYFRRSK